VSLEKRHDSKGRPRWVVRFRQGGRNRARTFDLRGDALHFESEVRRRKQLGQLAGIVGPRLTLSELHDRWWPAHAKEIAPSTRQNVEGCWNAYVGRDLGATRLNELTPFEIEKWLLRLAERGVGPSSVHRAHLLLRQMLARAEAWGLVGGNAAAIARRPKTDASRRHVEPPSPLDIELVRALMRRPRDATLVSVLAYAGLRPGEALALTWDDVSNGCISVSKAASLGEVRQTKTGRSRRVRLEPWLAEDLELYRGHGSPTIVFGPDVWDRNDWSNWRRGPWARAVAGARLPKETRPYDLRHGRASMLLAAGVAPVEAAAELGHNPATLLRTYAHVIREIAGRGPVDLEAEVRRAREHVANPFLLREALDRHRDGVT
jgi:integrase